MRSIFKRVCIGIFSRICAAFKDNRIAACVLLSVCLSVTAPSVCAALPGSATETGKPVSADEIALHWKFVFYDSPVSVLFLLPGIAGFLIAGFVKRKKHANIGKGVGFFILIATVLLVSASGFPIDKKSIVSGLDAYNSGRYKEAVELLSASRVKGIVLPYLEYDIALAERADRNFPGALLVLYRSLRMSPGERIIRELITDIETDEGIAHQLDPVPALDPDIPFIIAMILFDTACIFLGLFLRNKRKPLFVLLLVTSAFFVTAGALAGYYIREAGIPFSVSGSEGADMKKLPIPDFEADKKIRPGTLLRVYGEANGFMLVETGTGLKGWVSTRQVIAPTL
jgi:hypothetical protein